jgi:FkbM family methyltransferase
VNKLNIENIYLALRKRLHLIFTGRYFVVQKKGVRYLLDIYGYIDRRVEAYGVYERDQLSYFMEQVTQLNPSLFIDAGANSGLYSVNVALRFPGLKVIAFEPDTRNRAQLYGNLFLNEIQDIVAVEGVALSDYSGTARFHRHDKENSGRSMLSEKGEYSVPVTKLDDVISAIGDRIAIKIDVEGSELPLLKGAQRLLKENECFIQVESFSPDGVINFFGQLGYFLQMHFGNDYYFCRKKI